MISDEIIESFIFCKYKTYLILNREEGEKSDFANVEYQIRQILKTNYLENIKRSYHGDQIAYSTLPLSTKTLKSSSIIVNPEVRVNDFLIGFDAIEISISRKHHQKSKIVPIIVSPKEKISINEKLLLTIKTLMLNQTSGSVSEVGKIIYGRNLKSTSIRVKDYKRTAQKLIDELDLVIKNNQKPLIFRKESCRICEFEKTCLNYLIEKDDLSLLGGIRLNEILKRNKNGIFTINQLSYNFRPKRFLKIREKGRPFSHELKALAIRDKKIYILELTESDIKRDTEIFVDFEGLPDEDYVYLIGVIIRSNGLEKKVSLWADSKQDERKIFEEFLEVLEQYDDHFVYHYGSYEIKELRRIAKLYPHLEKSISNKMLSRSINLLSFFYTKIYFPTYTNGLKDIAGFLGFRWSVENARGVQSIAWRKHWEFTNESKYKNILLQYNIEDCQASILINDWMNEITKKRDQGSSDGIGRLNDIRERNLYKFGKTNYLLPDYEKINNCAYYDYQRERVFLKTNSKIRKLIKKRIIIHEKPKIKIDNRIKITLPEKCPSCENETFYKHDKRKRIVVDLRFSEKGVKRWVTEYDTSRFRCRSCYKVFSPDNFKNLSNRYGRGVSAWTINQHIAYAISFKNILNMLLEYFNISMDPSYLHRLQSNFAIEYKETYSQLLDNITRGHLLHIDETQVKIRNTPSGYVWTFANIDTVFYLFRPDRESGFLREILKEFHGVLISDFYCGYDSIDCPQQKCLIHFIRDLNDDLTKNPFDTEFKQIASQFGQVLRSIIETIERYGLKRRYLRKHHKSINRFIKQLFHTTYNSELAIQYQKRFRKNKDKLFTFLDYDEIPWNNNNAEHAIKGFAVHRRNVNGLFSKKTIEEFLILLSIYQTCKYKGLSFFHFLLSREKNVFSYHDKSVRSNQALKLTR